MGSGMLRPTAPARVAIDAERAERIVDLVGERVYRDVVIPRTNVRGKMRLITRAEKSQIREDVRRELGGRGFPVDVSALSALGAGEEWHAELAVRTLQKAIRDPNDPSLELAPLEDWRDCDEGQLDALLTEYEDLEALLDPLGGTVELTEGELAALVDAAKKKAVNLLLSYGSRKLAALVTTLVARLESSATAPSS